MRSVSLCYRPVGLSTPTVDRRGGGARPDSPEERDCGQPGGARPDSRDASEQINQRDGRKMLIKEVEGDFPPKTFFPTKSGKDPDFVPRNVAASPKTPSVVVFPELAETLGPSNGAADHSWDRLRETYRSPEKFSENGRGVGVCTWLSLRFEYEGGNEDRAVRKRMARQKASANNYISLAGALDGFLPSASPTGAVEVEEEQRDHKQESSSEIPHDSGQEEPWFGSAQDLFEASIVWRDGCDSFSHMGWQDLSHWTREMWRQLWEIHVNSGEK